MINNFGEPSNSGAKILDFNGADRQGVAPVGDLEAACRAACESVGIIFRDVPADGCFHRTNVVGKSALNDAGSLKVFPDGEGGIACNWVTGQQINFWSRNDRTLSPDERAARKRRSAEESERAKEERRRMQEAAKAEAAKLWAESSPVSNEHPYIIKKGIKPAGIRQHGDILLIPLHEIGSNDLSSLQRIHTDGTKRFIIGTVMGSLCHVLPGTEGTVFIVEGYATGCSVHAATGATVIVAFSAGRLSCVAAAVRKAFSGCGIVIAGDIGNGSEKAAKAAQEVQGTAVFPVMPEGSTGTDFNDLQIAAGIDEVKRQLKNSIEAASPWAALELLTVNKEYIAMIGKEEWVFQNLIIKKQITVIIAQSGGGKTSVLFSFVAPWVINNTALTVWYFDLDSPASDHERMSRQAREYGTRMKWVNPLTHGKGPELIVEILEKFIKTGVRLDEHLFVFDTLKKFIDMLDKRSVKPFFNLMRQLAALGATVVLLGHANKHRDTASNLVFEGVGDVRSDADALLFFERITSPGGGTDITTVCDPDKGAKVRGLYEPISFHIGIDRTVTLNSEVVKVPDWRAGRAKERRPSKEEVVAKIEEFLTEVAVPQPQNIIVESLKGCGVGVNVIRETLISAAEAESGRIYCSEVGQFNKKVYGVKNG